MATNYKTLEEEKNKPIPEDVPQWIYSMRCCTNSILARLAYRILDLKGGGRSLVPAELLIIPEQLFLLTPKDYALDESRHTIKFATYGRHCACSHEEGETEPTLRIKTRGWVTPVHCKDKDMIKVTYEKVTDADQLKGMIGNYRAAKLNVYRLQFNGGELTDTSKWSVLGVHQNTTMSYYELNRKLGVRILDNGVPVSEWIPFYVNRVYHNDDSKHAYAMININLGNTEAPSLSSGDVD